MNSDSALDASVCINLLGTGEMPVILRALWPRRCFAVDHVFREVSRDPLDLPTAEPPLAGLVKDGLIFLEKLSPPQVVTMLELAGATEPDDLDDGEAATIAFCHHAGTTAVVDEAKARRVCRTRFPAIRVQSTLDILRCPEVAVALPGTRLAEAVFSALRVARMRVPPEHLDWVRDLIGSARVAECPSLRSHVRNGCHPG